MTIVAYLNSQGYEWVGPEVGPQTKWLTPRAEEVSKTYTRATANEYLCKGHSFYPQGCRECDGWYVVV